MLGYNASVNVSDNQRAYVEVEERTERWNMTQQCKMNKSGMKSRWMSAEIGDTRRNTAAMGGNTERRKSDNHCKAATIVCYRWKRGSAEQQKWCLPVFANFRVRGPAAMEARYTLQVNRQGYIEYGLRNTHYIILIIKGRHLDLNYVDVCDKQNGINKKKEKKKTKSPAAKKEKNDRHSFFRSGNGRRISADSHEVPFWGMRQRCRKGNFYRP